MNGISTASFDCYGTLIDWEGGTAAFLYDLALSLGDQPTDSARDMRDRWEEMQFKIIGGRYRPYKQVLAESLRDWSDERGYPWNPLWPDAFVRAMRSWQPFPDVIPALTRVRQRGIRLAILSNTDNDIISHSLRHLRVPFDLVVTTEDCGSYKPSMQNFERLLQALDQPAPDILHVAFGFKYDIGPAKQLGMGGAWINRNVEPQPDGVSPDVTWRDLWGLAAFVGDPGPGR